jgi:pyrimidine-specific ribonucleoside hydrolase
MNRRQFVASSGALTLESLAHSAWSVAPVAREQYPSPKSGSYRVIIDTDPGYDDALALLFAMSSPELNIEAITAVSGNLPIDITLANALRMVEVAGRTDIPVASGPKTPLFRQGIFAPEGHGENGLAGAVFPPPTVKPVDLPAAELIRSVVRKYPGEVTLIPIGPHTNIATALLADPELAGMIRGIVMMGGSLSGGNITPAAEFNIYVDPEAARIVFHSGIPITMVGLDVTNHVVLTEEHVHTLEVGDTAVSQGAGKIARAVLELWRKRGFVSKPILFDEVAVAEFLDPKILRLEEFYIDVETSGDITAGETVGYSPIHGPGQHWLSPEAPHPEHRDPAYYRPPKIRGSAPSIYRPDSSPFFTNTYKPNAKVGVDVDVERFFRLFIGRLSGKHVAIEN